jgi:hypothetical protein
MLMDVIVGMTMSAMFFIVVRLQTTHLCGRVNTSSGRRKLSPQ